MSDEHSTPVGTPVVLAPGRIVLVGEYAALTDGSTVEAAFGCYAKAQFVPQKDSAFTMTLLAAILDRIKVELAELAPALPPGTVLVTNEDFRTLGASVAGVGGSAAMAVAAVGAVLESLGLALESRKPLVLSIADAARRRAQGYVGSGSDTAAATHGGLIRTGRAVDGQRQPSPMAAPAGLHLVVFAAGPARPPAEVARALQSYARADAISFLGAVAQLRELSQRFLDEVASGQATGAITAAGKYGEVLQGLCAAAEAPIMNEAFTRAAGIARELGGIAKPTGAGNGEVGVALFATPEACQYFRKACTGPLAALEGDLDAAGVRCEFPDNAIVADLDERDSAELPEAEPDEFDMPTVKTAAPVLDDADEAVSALGPVDPAYDEELPEAPARRPRWPFIVLIVVILGLVLGYEIHRRSRTASQPLPRPAPASLPPSAPSEEPAAPVQASPPAPTTAQTDTDTDTQAEVRPSPSEPRVERPSNVKPRRRGGAIRKRTGGPRAGRLRPEDF